jgi:hypothetical protein
LYEIAERVADDLRMPTPNVGRRRNYVQDGLVAATDILADLKQEREG